MGSRLFNGNLEEMIKAGAMRQGRLGGSAAGNTTSSQRGAEMFPNRSQEPSARPREQPKTLLLEKRFELEPEDAPQPRQGANRQPTMTAEEGIRRLIQEARLERLEWALPLIESMQICMTADRTTSRTLPGAMTVQNWIGLLNRWENQLSQTRKRHIFFAKPFFEDALERSEADNSPLTPILQELVSLMDRSLEVT